MFRDFGFIAWNTNRQTFPRANGSPSPPPLQYEHTSREIFPVQAQLWDQEVADAASSPLVTENVRMRSDSSINPHTGATSSRGPLATARNPRTTFGIESTDLIVNGELSGPSNSSASKIPKPEGPLSKPAAGGYSLASALGWSREDYAAVQNGLHNICDNTLNLTLSYSKQDRDDLMRYENRACQRFPVLTRYQGAWPAHSFAEMYLKNKSSAHNKRRRRGQAPPHP